MDARTAAHVLQTIAAYLELRGENRFKARAYESAAAAVLALGADDLAPAYRSGELAGLSGVGPATLAVLRDLVETGESRYLEQLRAEVPEGLLEMLRVPSLTPSKIFKVYDTLGIDSIEELERAATDGRLASLPRWGPKTATKILDGIAFMRETGALALYPHALVEGKRLLALVRDHPDVARAELAGALRRHAEVVGDIVIVAGCRTSPERVAESFARLPGIRRAAPKEPGRVVIDFVDGARLDLRCVDDARFALALWRATGSAEHVEAVEARLAKRGVRVSDIGLTTGDGAPVTVHEEADVYRAAGLAYVPPEPREGLDELRPAKQGAPIERLIESGDLRGVLHCHSVYSDGKATIPELVEAARARGWSYIGITDHSEAAFYAGGLSRERVRAQHAEIDELNASLEDFTVLKGVEADILADGRLDYDAKLLDRFDYVIGSVHSRFSMDGAAMTERVLRAMDDPHLTILGHPTGRLLLSRKPYALDMDAVIERAAERGVAIELNADPHRLDIDWRLLPKARAAGATIEIGPDAHSTRGLDNVHFGVGMARKGMLTAADVLNTRSAADVIAFARARR